MIQSYYIKRDAIRIQSTSTNWPSMHWSLAHRLALIQQVIGSLIPTASPHVYLWTTTPRGWAWTGVLNQDSVLNVLGEFRGSDRPIDSNHQKGNQQEGFHLWFGVPPFIARNRSGFDRSTMRTSQDRLWRHLIPNVLSWWHSTTAEKQTKSDSCPCWTAVQARLMHLTSLGEKLGLWMATNNWLCNSSPIH